MSLAILLEKRLWIFKISEWILMIMIVSYAIIFSHYTIMRHYSFRSDAWDLGLIVQSIANAIKGRLFTNNVELFFSPTGSYFGVHFAPVLFLVVPFFYFIRSVETILVLQSVALALGAIPVYLLAIHVLNDRISALFIAASYLLNPLLQGVNWYDFHTQAFFPLFILSAIYFLKRKRVIFFILFLLMGLSTIEQTTYFILACVPYSLLEVRSDLRNCNRRFRFKIILQRSIMPLIMLIVSISWLILSSAIKNAINPNPPKEMKAISQFKILDINDPAEIPIKVILNPYLALEAFRYELPKKIFYIILTFAHSCFLALLSPLVLLPVFLWFFIAVLSNWTPYYSLGFQYSAFTLPFTYIALIDAIKRIVSGFSSEISKPLIRRVSALILLVGIILSFFLSPISFIHKVGNYDYFRDYGVTVPSAIENHVRQAIMKISGEPFILATSRVFPHLSINSNAYTVPPLNYPSPELFRSFIEYLKNNIEFDYVLIESFWDKGEANLIYAEFIKPNRNYGLLIRGAGLELYKRGYSSLPENIIVRFTSKELYAANVIIMDDPTAEAGRVMVFKVSSTSTKVIWYGPYVALPPGNYTARFRIKVDQILNGKLIDLEVYSRYAGRIALRSIYGEEISGSSMWHTFYVAFNLKSRVSDVEFRGVSSGNNVTICLDYIEVIPE
ncbi:MAG: DUF2079 domain-containing protein [Candidatus Bathyarchaeia archaeon]